MENVEEPGAWTLIQRQARMWLVRMDGDKRLTEAERAALKEWMSRSARHRKELVRLARFWNQANILTELVGCFGSGRRYREVHRDSQNEGR
jgi:ferric-dicitrate binding protein FerR (iron transport regulator)